MLEFSSPPDYEAPSGEGGTSNTYKVVVAAADSDAATEVQTGYHKVTVEVTKVAEEGEVTWIVDPSTESGVDPNDPADDEMPIMQFQVGALLTASATDGDIGGTTKTVVDSHVDVPAEPTWRWYRSPSKTSMGTMIDGANEAVYTVTTADVGMHLRAVAYYVITGNVGQETASLTSDYPVLAIRPGNNELKFAPAAVELEVAEGKKGAVVGAPVTAMGNHGAINYTFGNTTNGPDNAKFEIDQKTGQITTNMDLEYDTSDADNCRDENDCSVTVRATDASGSATAQSVATNVFVDAIVTIKVTDVDEKPTFTPDAMKTITRPENETDLAEAADIADVTYTAMDPEGRSVTYRLMGPDGARFQLKQGQVLSFRTAPDYEMPTDANRDNVYEVTVRASDGTLYADRMVKVAVTPVDDAPAIMGRDSVSYPENGKDPVATYTATDPEGATPIIWSIADADDISGNEDLTTADNADADHFEIDDKDGVLEFSSPPDYEAPSGEGGTSNTYKVVVAAADSDAATEVQTGYHKVTVEVTKVAEEGEVTWIVDPSTESGVDPNDPADDEMPIMQFQVGALLTASATDGDLAGEGKAIGTEEAPTWRWYRGRNLIDTPDAKDNIYTVTTADRDSRLRVTVTYRVTGNTNQKTASLTSDYTVLAVRPGNNELKFAPAAVEREVNEGEKGMTVGAPVTATDNHGAVNYTLSGTDADKFEIDRKTGQITTDVEFDYEAAAGAEDNCDTTQNECTVTVMATDASGEATATPAIVAITLKNVDEKPTFGEVDRTTDPDANVMNAEVPENSTADIATYTATDPEELNVNLTLMGPDAAMFSLGSGGALSFRTAPDYENPTDANRDNVYEVTVRASDGTLYEDRMVMVTVTPMNEAPIILSDSINVSGRASVSYAENGPDAVATYTAQGASAAMARWSLSGDDAGDFRLSSSSGMSTMLMFRTSPDFEMPADADGDNVYMVTVKAMEGDNMNTRDVAVTVTDMVELGVLSGESAITYMEKGMNAVETYTADGPVTPTWSLSGDDADDFSIRGGMLTFAMSPNFEAPTDLDMDNMYMVTVMASAGGEMDMMDVTVTVANVEETGEVTLWAGTVALTVPPQVGDTITGLVKDDDGGITVESWQWSRTMTPDMMASWMDIDGATNAAYMVTAGDTGYHLRVMATYTDAVGTDMAMESSMPTMMVGATVVVDEMGEVTLWAGNDPLTMAPQVGDTITGAVMDPDGGVTGEMWQWSRTMDTADMSSWMDIQGATNADYMVTADDTGYYLRVMATYMDAVGTDMAMEYSPATMMVIAADEDPLVARYDADNSGTIEKPEVLDAINDYLFDLGDPITKEDVIRLITLYLFG